MVGLPPTKVIPRSRPTCFPETVNGERVLFFRRPQIFRMSPSHICGRRPGHQKAEGPATAPPFDISPAPYPKVRR